MSENRWQAAFQAIRKVSQGAQHQLSQFTGGLANKPPTPDAWSLFSLGFSKPHTVKVKPDAPANREELGRATWTFLHTLAAQYPGQPTKKQKKDVRELMDILSRLYPCKDCADHFKNILRKNPVQAESQAEFAQWLCVVHNDVNKRLDKVPFPCHDVDIRWGQLECEKGVCELPGTAVDERH